MQRPSASVMHVRVPDELKASVESRAQSECISASDVIRRALNFYLQVPVSFFGPHTTPPDQRPVERP